MLDYTPGVIETENVNTGIVVIPRPALMTVQGNEVALGNGALEHCPFARIFTRHPLEVIDERFHAIAYMGIVLDVLPA